MKVSSSVYSAGVEPNIYMSIGLLKNKMGKILKYWPKEEIIKALQKLPKDKLINKKSIIKYAKQKLICESSLISRKFGSLKEACNQAGIRCDALYGKEKINYMQKLNTKWNKKNISAVLKKAFKENNIIKIKDYRPFAKKSKNIPSPDVIKKFYGTMRNALKENNIEFQDYYWSKERIIKQLRFLDKNFGPLAKCQIKHEFSKQGLICRGKCITDVCGSMNNAAKLAGIEFVEAQEKGYNNGKVGKKEKQELDKIEIKKNIKLERQFPINVEGQQYYIDGYDIINKIAYEIDDKTHKLANQIRLDNVREENIKNEIGCEFERIKIF